MRSIRLSGAYRALYRLVQENGDVFVSLEEVSKHGY